jgi:AcrR family transcriptional regulator
MTEEQDLFATYLAFELRKMGFPVAYSALKRVLANWFWGNAQKRYPQDNNRLAFLLTKAISDWQERSNQPAKLFGFIVMAFKREAADAPESREQKPDRAEATSISDSIRAWQESRATVSA